MLDISAIGLKFIASGLGVKIGLTLINNGVVNTLNALTSVRAEMLDREMDSTNAKLTFFPSFSFPRRTKKKSRSALNESRKFENPRRII